MDDYKLFHAKRIFDVVLGYQTPCNDYDCGKSTCGNFTIRDNRGKLREVLCSMVEMKIISTDDVERMMDAYSITIPDDVTDVTR